MCRDNEKGRKMTQRHRTQEITCTEKSSAKDIVKKISPLNKIRCEHRCIACESAYDFQIYVEPSVSHSTLRWNEMSCLARKRKSDALFFVLCFFSFGSLLRWRDSFSLFRFDFRFHFFYSRLSCIFYIPIWLQ